MINPNPDFQRQTTAELPAIADDGYVVQRSGRTKCDPRIGITIGDAADRKRAPWGSTEPPTRSVPDSNSGKRSKHSRQTTFQFFQRTEALGHYGVLTQEGSDDEETGVDTDAMSDISLNGYALAQSPVATQLEEEEGDHSMDSADDSPHAVFDAISREPEIEPDAASAATMRATSAVTNTSLKQTSLTAYVLQTEVIPANTSGTTLKDALGKLSYVPATPDSQQEFTIGAIHRPVDPAVSVSNILVAQFLDSFEGSEVTVEANGQCAMLVFFATTSNHSTRLLKNTDKVNEMAGVVKKGVHALLLANLRRDVDADLLDTVTVYHELYPHHTEFES
ncbi:unnamed protein product [Phytophthora fragariaefolia]|uniref:Unnamed protein product n=1 Tax=Phytophthora fragariaefolia TaxID=1490495 RepID=A0A9W6TZ81_9STRA|nr:unnamed protein product [Phytophthora fragariaefolia]